MAIVRAPFGVAVVAAAVITLVAGWSAAAPLPEGLLPQTTVTGTPVPELGAKRGVVIGFLGVGCPVARQYAVRLGEIANRFADQGITVIGVDANPQDTADELAATGRELELDYALLRDEGQRIARHVGRRGPAGSSSSTGLARWSIRGGSTTNSRPGSPGRPRRARSSWPRSATCSPAVPWRFPAPSRSGA